jgi:hypothetical protein
MKACDTDIGSWQGLTQSIDHQIAWDLLGNSENVGAHYRISTRLRLNPELHQVKIKRFYSFQNELDTDLVIFIQMTKRENFKSTLFV